MHKILVRSSVFALVLVAGVVVVQGQEASAQTPPNGTGGYNLTAIPGSQPGTVVLNWKDTDLTNNYSVMFGPSPTNFLYGAVGVGNVSTYTVQSLNPGQTYYFSLIPSNSGAAQVPTAPVSGTAAGPGVTSTPAQVAQAVSQGGLTFTSGPVGNYQLRAWSGPNPGQVTLGWVNYQNPTASMIANNFDVVYGPSQGNWLYGAQNVGNTTQYTVGALNSGQVYYFALLPQNGANPLGYTPEVAAKAQ